MGDAPASETKTPQRWLAMPPLPGQDMAVYCQKQYSFSLLCGQIKIPCNHHVFQLNIFTSIYSTKLQRCLVAWKPSLFSSLHLPQLCMRVAFSPYLCQHLFIDLLKVATLVGVRQLSHCSFTLHISDD